MLALLLVFAAIVILLISIFFYCNCVRPMRYWKDRGVEQGSPVWIFGHYWQNFIGIRNGPETFLEIYKQTPKLRYTGFYRFSTPTLVVKDPELIKKITVTDFDAFTDQPMVIPVEGDPLWANNLFNLKGSKWKHVRTCLNPCFTSSQISGLFPQITHCAENVLSHLLQNDDEVISLEIKDIFSRYASDVIATTAFGLKVDSLANRNNEFYKLASRISDVSTFWKMLGIKMVWFVPAILKFVKVKVISDEAAAYFLKLLDANINSKECFFLEAPNGQAQIHLPENKAESNDSLDFPKSPLGMSNENITAHAISFFMAGLQSVASSISLTIYELALNPDIQEKLRLEIFATFKDCAGRLTYEAILSMKYMDMVVSESLRKWPPFTIVAKLCTKPYTIAPVLPWEELVHIEEGVEVKIPLYAIHHDPKYYPEPERFDPERFSDENKKYIYPYTYFPFGLGPRSCIGDKFSLIEIKVMLFHLLSQFNVVTTEKTAVPLKFYRNTIFNLKPVDGIWIGFKRYKG